MLTICDRLLLTFFRMTDEQFIRLVFVVTRELMAWQPRTAAPSGNAGPRFHEGNTFTIEEEPFSRWMGWRGQDAQEQECSWPADELKAERQARHMKEFKRLRDENAELWRFLFDLQKGLERFLEKRN